MEWVIFVYFHLAVKYVRNLLFCNQVLALTALFLVRPSVVSKCVFVYSFINMYANVYYSLERKKKCPTKWNPPITWNSSKTPCFYLSFEETDCAKSFGTIFTEGNVQFYMYHVNFYTLMSFTEGVSWFVVWGMRNQCRKQLGYINFSFSKKHLIYNFTGHCQ